MAGGCPLTAVRRTRSFCIGRATEGRSFYVQIKDQFRPTWRSYAGPPQQRRISVPVDGDPLGSKYRYSRKQGGSEGAGRRRAFGPGRPVRPGNGFAFRAGSEGSYVVSLPLGRWVPVGANICRLSAAPWFSTGEAWLCGFHSTKWNYKLIARQGDTTTLGPEGPVKLKNLKNLRPQSGRPPSPLNLLNPLNLHARRACPLPPHSVFPKVSGILRFSSKVLHGWRW